MKRANSEHKRPEKLFSTTPEAACSFTGALHSPGVTRETIRASKRLFRSLKAESRNRIEPRFMDVRCSTAERDRDVGSQVMSATKQSIRGTSRIRTEAEILFQRQRQRHFERTDRMFAVLMLCQWIGGIAAAIWISPRTWHGTESQTHLHVWLAVFLGGAIASLPIYLALRHPGRT